MADWPDNPRSLRVMFEWSTSVIWNVPDKGGDTYGAWSYEELRLPADLRHAFVAWRDRFADALRRDKPRETEVAELHAQGKVLARRLKDHLGPDVRVSYENDEIL